MQNHTIIEEITDEDGATSFDGSLQEILKASGNDGKQMLASVFAFLKQNTSFFEDPEASKVLARLLRDVKKLPTKGATSSLKPQQPDPNKNPELPQVIQVTGTRLACGELHSRYLEISCKRVDQSILFM